MLLMWLALPSLSQENNYILIRNGNERLTRCIDKITYSFDGENFFENTWIGSHKYENRVDSLGIAYFYSHGEAPLYVVEEEYTNGWDFVLTNNNFNLCYKQSETAPDEEYVLIQSGEHDQLMFRLIDSDVTDFRVNEKIYFVTHDKSKLEFSIYTANTNGTLEHCYTGITESESIRNNLAIITPPNPDFNPTIMDHCIRFGPNLLQILDYTLLYRDLSNAQTFPEYMTTLGSFVIGAAAGIVAAEFLGPPAITIGLCISLIDYYDNKLNEHGTLVSLGDAQCHIYNIHPIAGGKLEIAVTLNNAGTIPDRVYFANNSSAPNRVQLYLVGSTISSTSDEYNPTFSSQIIEIPSGINQGDYTFTVNAPRKVDNYQVFFKPILQADNFSMCGDEQHFIRSGASFPYVFEPPVCVSSEVLSKSSTAAKIAVTFENINEITSPGLVVSSDDSHFRVNAKLMNGEQIIELKNLSPNTQYSYIPFVEFYDGPENGQTYSFTTLASVFGQWTCVWNTTPPNAKLITMTLNSDYTMSQTYYYANRQEYVTYNCTFSLNDDTLVFHKSDGDEQIWHIDEATDDSLIISQSDGFTYSFVLSSR